MNRSRRLSCLFSSILLVPLGLLGGCSGGSPVSGPDAGNASPPPPPPVMAAREPAPRPAVGVPAPGAQRVASQSKANGNGGHEITTQSFESALSRTDVEIVPPEGPSLGDQFEVFAPAAGASYSNVTVTWPQVVDVPGIPRFSLPAGFTAIPDARGASGSLPWRIRCEGDGSEMVLVPSGIFLQGTDAGPPECGPLHPAYVSSFYIDVTEVTLAQFERFQQRQRTQKKGTLPNPANIGDDPRKPALGLSWRDADLYARQLGKDLPTEAEWEKAARGVQGFSFPWGESRPAWNLPRQPGQIDPVGLYSADRSPFDVLDMAGNAREWCGDWYSPLTYQSVREKDGSPIRDSKGSSRAEPIGHRVVKGNPNGWESWHRGALPQRDGFPDVGFRCVLRGVELTSPAANPTPAPATGPARPVVAPEAPASKPASPF